MNTPGSAERIRADRDAAGAALTLASLHGVGPVRLRSLCGGDPCEGLERLRRGGTPLGLDVDADLVSRWVAEARRADPDRLLDQHGAAGVQVMAMTDPAFPAVFAHDPDAPALLCWRGDLSLLDRVTVGIIGTRRSSR